MQRAGMEKETGGAADAARSLFDPGPLRSAVARRAVPTHAAPPPVELKWLFEAGLPDPVTFPAADLARLTDRVLREEAADALQYGDAGDDAVTRGFVGLRDVLAERGNRRDARSVDRRGVMLTSGAAQAIMLAFEAFLDPGDVVAVESPTWNAVLAAVERRGAELLPLALDDDGIRIDAFEAQLDQLAAAGKRLKLLHTIATFNTPTGVCLSLDRRAQLVELAQRWNFVILEDNVYYELRYDGAQLPTLFSLDGSGLVLTIDSFSKVVAPGVRLGWVTGAPPLIDTLASVRGDLGVSQLMARVVARYVEESLLDPHIAEINALYRAKRDAAEAALHAHCSPWVRWRTPDGGFFLWVELDRRIDAARVMQRALAGGVLCRAGERFFGDAKLGRQFFRLAFPSVPIAEIDRGIAVLGRAIADSIVTEHED